MLIKIYVILVSVQLDISRALGQESKQNEEMGETSFLKRRCVLLDPLLRPKIGKLTRNPFLIY